MVPGCRGLPYRKCSFFGAGCAHCHKGNPAPLQDRDREWSTSAGHSAAKKRRPGDQYIHTKIRCGCLITGSPVIVAGRTDINDDRALRQLRIPPATDAVRLKRGIYGMKLFIDPFSEFRLIKTQAAAWIKKHGLFSFHLVMKRPDFLYGCRQENQNRTQEHARR